MKTLVLAPEYYPEQILRELNGVTEIDLKKMARKELLSCIEDYDAILTRVDINFDKELLDKATKLKVIATSTTGTDHIDLEYAKQKGIQVFSAPGVNATATAEHTIGMILSLVRKIPQSFNSVIKGSPDRSKFIGNELNGKMLGVVGFGKIGSQVAKIAKSFGMKIVTFDPFLNRQLVDEVGARVTSFDELVRDSDVITLHAFASPENENMISYDEFDKMKKNSILINVARGSLIDEEALLDALTTMKIQGAALDVIKEEPASENNPLVAYARMHDNLIITPHIGGSTKEAVINAATLVVQKVRDVLHAG